MTAQGAGNREGLTPLERMAESADLLRAVYLDNHAEAVGLGIPDHGVGSAAHEHMQDTGFDLSSPVSGGQLPEQSVPGQEVAPLRHRAADKLAAFAAEWTKDQRFGWQPLIVFSGLVETMRIDDSQPEAVIEDDWLEGRGY